MFETSPETGRRVRASFDWRARTSFEWQIGVSIESSLACHVCVSRASWYFPHAPPRGTSFVDDTWEVLPCKLLKFCAVIPLLESSSYHRYRCQRPQRLVHQLTVNSSQRGNLKEIHTYSTSELNPTEVVTSLTRHRTGAERLNDDETADVSACGVEFR